MKLKHWVTLPLALLGCTSVGQSVRQVTQDHTLYSDDGAYMGAQITAALRPIFSPSSKEALWKMGIYHLDRLNSALKSSKRKYRLNIVRAPFENAFASSDGQIFVTELLFESVETDDALAGVFAHEIGHVELDHAVKKMDSSSSYFSMMMNYKMSQSQELAADEFGTALMAKAGYSVSGLREFLKRHQALLAENHEDDGGFLSTHPATGERVSKLEKQETALSNENRVPIPPSVQLKAWKTSEFLRAKELGRVPSFEEDPERNPDLGSLVAKLASEARVAVYQGEATEAQIAKLQGALRSSTVSSKEKGVLEIWLGRLLAHQFRHQEAFAHFEAASRLLPEWETPLWRMQLSNLAQGKKAEAIRFWKARKADPSCLKNLDCLSWAALITPSLGQARKIQGETAHRFREFTIAAEDSNPTQVAAQTPNLSVTFQQEVEAGFERPVSAREKHWEFPSQMDRTQNIKDWISLDKEARAQNWSLLDPSGLLIGFSLGVFRSVSSNYKPAVGGATGLSVDMAWMQARWIFGLKFSGGELSPSRGVFPDNVKQTEFLQLGLSVARLFSFQRLRPWLGAEVAIAGLSYTPPLNTESKTIARGLGVQGTGGFDYRLSAMPHPLEYWLTTQIGFGTALLGANEVSSGNLTYWTAQLGFRLLLVNQNMASSGLRMIEPPVFY